MPEEKQRKSIRVGEIDKMIETLESQEGTFPDACIVTCLTTALKGDKM